MKTLLLICCLLLGVQTFSFSPGSSAILKPHALVLPGNLKAMTLQEFLTLTPKKYRELTGKRMSIKQQLAFFILKAKLKNKLPDDKSVHHKTDLGLLSLVFGGAAWLFVFIPEIGIISIGFAIAAVVLGILGLSRKKGDTKSIIGLVLGSLFVVLLLVAIIALASDGWY